MCVIPLFAGFYSKDTIIEAAQIATIPGSQYAYFCVSIGALVTALYTFRALFMTFHGTPRMTQSTWKSVHETSSVVWIPLILLAIPSVVIGYILFEPILYAKPALLSQSFFVLPEHNVLGQLAHHAQSSFDSMMHAPNNSTFWLTVLGIFLAWLCYSALSAIPTWMSKKFSFIYRLLLNKYGFDKLNDYVIVTGSKKIGSFFYKVGDQKFIDGLFVNGSGTTIRELAARGRRIQTGYLYHYVTFMVIGLFLFLSWFIFG